MSSPLQRRQSDGNAFAPHCRHSGQPFDLPIDIRQTGPGGVDDKGGRGFPQFAGQEICPPHTLNAFPPPDRRQVPQALHARMRVQHRAMRPGIQS